MNAERFEQIDQIFQSALDLAPNLRAEFLDAECGRDAELRAEVESLLSAHQHAGDFIEDSASDVAASLLEENPKHPRQVGQYKIERLLGAGGMGEVYLATDKAGRCVALKLLASHLHRNQQYVTRFLQEARTVLALNHPNIVTIYEIGETFGSYYIASELIEGETLRRHLETCELELGALLEIAIQVATALAAAHEKGIVHRDIKPENVMIRSDGYVKVLDFGIAKLTEDFEGLISPAAPAKPKVETEEGIVVGTASYMSPEQAREFKVDARADIWSCGVMLYEMLAGQMPFVGGSTAETVAHILEREPAPLARYVTECPVELQRIVSKALMKNRAERYQTIKDLLLDLKALKKELEFAAKRERSIPPAEDGVFRTSGAAVEHSELELVTTTSANALSVSSAEYLLNEIKHHKRGAAFVLSLLLLSVIGLGFWFFDLRPANVTTIESIAVLPFVNASGNPEIEYLSDGMSESLINRLSELPGVKVIARSSSFKYKGKDVDQQEVARSLGVEAILTGRVEQRGETLSVSAELMDARDGTQVWGAQYTRKATDIQAVEEEIARTISEKLRLRLSGADERHLTKYATQSPQAYQFYLNGLFYMRKGGFENVRRALEYYNQAVTFDPNFALAWVGVANAYRELQAKSLLDPKVALARATVAAQKALDLDQMLPDAHAALARVKQDEWDWAGAERGYKRAIELNPNLAEAHARYSQYLSATGQTTEALAESKRAQELDPLQASRRGWGALYSARRYDELIEKLQLAIKLEPDVGVAHGVLAATYDSKGMHDQAINEYQEWISIDGETTSILCYLGHALAMSGKRGEARAILNKLKTTKEYVSPVELAALYIGLGDKEGAMSLLEKGYDAHDPHLENLKVDPLYDSLRPDPRFQDLMRRVGLAP